MFSPDIVLPDTALATSRPATAATTASAATSSPSWTETRSEDGQVYYCNYGAFLCVLGEWFLLMLWVVGSGSVVLDSNVFS